MQNWKTALWLLTGMKTEALWDCGCGRCRKRGEERGEVNLCPTCRWVGSLLCNDFCGTFGHRLASWQVNCMGVSFWCEREGLSFDCGYQRSVGRAEAEYHSFPYKVTKLPVQRAHSQFEYTISILPLWGTPGLWVGELVEGLNTRGASSGDMGGFESPFLVIILEGGGGSWGEPFHTSQIVSRSGLG